MTQHASTTDSFRGPHGHEYGSLVACLRRFGNERLVYLPNPGNAGDALIALATYRLFKMLNLDVEIGDHTADYSGRIVLYGGGGSLIKNYPEAATFIRRNHSACKAFILLPATVRAHPELISSMGHNCYLYARENKSFDYLLTHCTDAHIVLSHDLAFLMDDTFLRQVLWNTNFVLGNHRWCSWLKMAIKFAIIGRTIEPTLSALRVDSEATDITRPDRNHDLSHYFTTREMLQGRMSPEICETTIKMMRLIMVQHKKIRTNRLHLAILGAIAGLQVEMLPNSYDKNVSVFEQSIASYFSNVDFISGKNGKKAQDGEGA